MADDVTGQPGAYSEYQNRNDGTVIRSYFVAPKKGPSPTVILLRGIAGPDLGYIKIANELAGAQYAALVHSWQIRGDDPDDETLVADIAAAIDFLSSEPATNPNRIAVFGYCKGGGQAIIAAAALPRIRSVVAFHGFARRRKGADASHVDPIDVVDKVKCPVLLLHGDQDTTSPVEEMRSLCSELTNRNATVAIHTYGDADHGFAVSTHKGFNEPAARDSFQRALGFLAQHLG